MMKKSIFQSAFVPLLFVLYTQEIYSRHFTIIIPSRNNSEWVERTLGSVASQSVHTWNAIYINDASTDDTAQKVEQFRKIHGLEGKIILINNEMRQGALANIVKAVYMCEDWDVMVTLDGDDWLSGPDVLKKLDAVYNQNDIWMTYGSYRQFPSGSKGTFVKPIPTEITASNTYRKHPWSVSHLRTFYAWLFKAIRLEDLKINGEYFPMSGDLACMFPMIEMSGGRFQYIPDILYIYNVQTPSNDHKLNRALQERMGRIIKNRPPYQPLDSVPACYLPRG